MILVKWDLNIHRGLSYNSFLIRILFILTKKGDDESVEMGKMK